MSRSSISRRGIAHLHPNAGREPRVRPEPGFDAAADRTAGRDTVLGSETPGLGTSTSSVSDETAGGGGQLG